MSKNFKYIAASVLGVLALASGFFASLMIGLARMDSGIITWTPQLIAICALPILFIGLAAYIIFRR